MMPGSNSSETMPPGRLPTLTDCLLIAPPCGPYRAALSPFSHLCPMSDLVHVDLEDAQAIAQNIEENLQFDEDVDREFWQVILTRLNIAIRHASAD